MSRPEALWECTIEQESAEAQRRKTPKFAGKAEHFSFLRAHDGSAPPRTPVKIAFPVSLSDAEYYLRDFPCR